MSASSPSDALRCLDCWLWRIDPGTGLIDTLAGANPLGPGVATWRAVLRMCTAGSRRALLDAVRALQRTDRPAEPRRIDGIEVNAAVGHRLCVDLLLGCGAADPHGRTWTGLVARQTPGHSRASAVPAWSGAEGPGRVGQALDDAGLGWWFLAYLAHPVELSPVAAQLSGFGKAGCEVPLGTWLLRLAPDRFARLLEAFEQMLGGSPDRLEFDLFDADPAPSPVAVPPAAGVALAGPLDAAPGAAAPTAGREGLRLTVLRARTPGRELVGLLQPIVDRPRASRAGAPSAREPSLPAPGTDAGIDRESLVREIHHRIKNHLQGMTGLIERYRSDYPGLEHALDAIGGQLHAIGTVYGLLAHSGRSDLSLEEITQAVSDGLHGIAPGGITAHFPEATPGRRIAEQYCVAIALIVNELVMNGIKHGRSDGHGPRVVIACESSPQGCSLSIRNAGALPPAFDFQSGAGVRTGLRLVRSMLPARGATLTILSRAHEVEVSLYLQPPVLLVQPAP